MITRKLNGTFRVVEVRDVSKYNSKNGVLNIVLQSWADPDERVLFVQRHNLPSVNVSAGDKIRIVGTVLEMLDCWLVIKLDQLFSLKQLFSKMVYGTIVEKILNTCVVDSGVFSCVVWRPRNVTVGCTGWFEVNIEESECE